MLVWFDCWLGAYCLLCGCLRVMFGWVVFVCCFVMFCGFVIWLLFGWVVFVCMVVDLIV